MNHDRVATLAVLFCCALCLAAGPLARAQTPLPRDEKNVEGRFANGLRYVVRANATPPGRVQMNLYVRTGAVNEKDDQNGLAHFLEHMAFDGSTHFKPGELIPLLSKLGMQFGADSNAFTGLNQTVYLLNLPDAKPETVDLGLKIFSDYAGGLLLDAKEIDAERGVILEEIRLRREGPAARIDKQRRKALFAGTKLEKHDIGGENEQIRSFTREQFVDYWDAYYRPDNMTLVVVGDIDPQDVIARAEPWLGKFQPRGEPRPHSKIGLAPTTAPSAHVFTDAELESATVSLMSFQPPEAPVTTVEQDVSESMRSLAIAIVNRRIGDLVSAGKAPFRFAGVSVDDFAGAYEVTDVSAVAHGEPQDWNAMLDAVIAEVNRAIDHGFAQSELDLQRAEWLASAKEAVQTEATRNSGSIIGELVSEIHAGRPHLSAQQELALVERVLATATPSDLHAALKRHFATRNFAYVVTMPSGKAGVTVPSSDEVLAAANAAWARKTEPPAEKELGGRLLAADPTPGKVATNQTDADLAITDVTFENGVVMHHKFLDYKKDQVIVHVTLPGGRFEESGDTIGLSALAGVILMQPATSKFTSTQVQDMMSGKNVRAFGGIGGDTLNVVVSGTPADLGAGLELVHALLTDGRLEQSAVDEWKKNQRQSLRQARVTPGLALRKAQVETLFGGDERFAVPTDEQIERLERNAAEAWFHRIAGGAAIEVSVAGDLPLERAIELVGTYIGSLPKRQRGFDALDAVRHVKRGPGPFRRDATFPGVTPQGLAFAGFVSCDQGDDDRRPLSLAALVLTERMIKRIREEEQLAYGIGTSNSPGNPPGTGTFFAASMTDPQKAGRLADTILEMFRQFAADGPTEEELATAKKQKATELLTSMKEPSFWAGEMRELVYRRRSLDDLKKVPAVYDTFTTNDLRDVVAKYMKDEAVFRFVVVPEPKSAPTTVGSGQ